jgi:hypothetical protein
MPAHLPLFFTSATSTYPPPPGPPRPPPPPPGPDLLKFCGDLEAAVIKTVEAGHMTKDLAICVHGTTKVCWGLVGGGLVDAWGLSMLGCPRRLRLVATAAAVQARHALLVQWRQTPHFFRLADAALLGCVAGPPCRSPLTPTSTPSPSWTRSRRHLTRCARRAEAKEMPDGVRGAHAKRCLHVFTAATLVPPPPPHPTPPPPPTCCNVKIIDSPSRVCCAA